MVEINDVNVTKRWKTVEDSNDGFFRMTTLPNALKAKEEIQDILSFNEEEKKVKLRIKRHLGLYFIQARLVG